ncbi:MAG: alpha-amylase family glycosyl hydrolase [Actinomycetota bacterium]
MSWWRSGVIYHVYVRSFADSNGDRIGDLRGVIDHLDHLEWLGIDAIWLSPVMRSPNADWGYDVADYRSVDPALGTLDDFDELVASAAKRGMHILNDLVPNHTSDQHDWFLGSRSSRDSAYRDWYVWADPAPDGGPPNNWISNFMGPAWTLDESTGQYYLHNFLAEQPDLNWWNPKVRTDFEETLRFWFDRGVAGFRIDVCHMIIKDAELRDNPAATTDDDMTSRLRGDRQVYNANRPELHDVLRRWREIARGYDDERALIGETFFGDIDLLPSFYGASDDELHLAFNIAFLLHRFDQGLADIVDTVERIFPSHATPAWVGSNHDVSRFPTRWAKGDERKSRLATMMLLTLRGTAFMYYGDEIGMEDRPFEKSEVLDPVGVKFHPVAGRDPERTPMQWHAGEGLGFTDAGVAPWLPFGDPSRNVAAQRADSGSILHLTKDLIALRREHESLRDGSYERVDVSDGVWTYRRGDDVVVALNLSDQVGSSSIRDGSVLVSTSRDRDGSSFDGSLSPWEGVVLLVTK